MVRRKEQVEVATDPLRDVVEVGTVDAGERDERDTAVGIQPPFYTSPSMDLIGRLDAELAAGGR